VTFLALAPEHPIAQQVAARNSEVADYVNRASRKSEIERAAVGEKDGAPTGLYVTHPLNGERLPLWVADYVIGTYGTGTVMGVPAHDTRDFAFAKRYGLPIRVVIQPADAPLDAGAMPE